MLYVLLGNETFLKKKFIEGLAREKALKVEVSDVENLNSEVFRLTGADLFNPRKILILNELDPTVLSEKNVDLLRACENHVMFCNEKMDMRKTATKQFLDKKGLVVKRFETPLGQDLERWINAYLQEKSARIEPRALQEMLGLMNAFEQGFEGAEIDLWQVASELDKLMLYEKELITLDGVKALVSRNESIKIFDLINALSSKNRGLVGSFLDRFYKNSTESEAKSLSIQLSGLLADQLRSLLLVKSWVSTGQGDDALLKKTGWKTGRLSVLKRISGNFNENILVSSLVKFEHLDLELKTSQTPSRPLVELIIAQMI